jgi:hypothetical protein
MFIQKQPKQLVEPELLVGTRKERTNRHCHLFVRREPQGKSKHRTHILVERVAEQVPMKSCPFSLLIILLVSKIED